jgi:hypothetical protein
VLGDVSRRCGPGGLAPALGHSIDHPTLGCPKLSQELHRYPPTLTDATDARIADSRRWPTPTDARKWLPKQVRYRTAPRPVSISTAYVCVTSASRCLMKTVPKLASVGRPSNEVSARSPIFAVIPAEPGLRLSRRGQKLQVYQPTSPGGFHPTSPPGASESPRHHAIADPTLLHHV